MGRVLTLRWQRAGIRKGITHTIRWACMARESSDQAVSDFPFSSEEEEEELFVCDECSETFETKRGENIHAGQVHDE